VKSEMYWNRDEIVEYFDDNRSLKQHIYPSEWVFIKDCLVENMSVLDIGCAQGGFSQIISEKIKIFKYVGLDSSEKMIKKAKRKNYKHKFYHIKDNDFSQLNDEKFNLVILLGILHLNESWKTIIENAWKHTHEKLILDLRETYTESIEDKNKSYFKFFNDLNNCNKILPYNIINSGEALKTICSICKNRKKLSHYGYSQAPSNFTVTNIEDVFVNVYCIEK